MLTSSMAKILRISFGLSAVTAIALIQGCASIVSGQDQIVSVDAPLCPASKCKLQNEEGVYWIPSTPGTVAVDREYGDLVVTCSKPGYQDFTMKVSSSTKGMAFGNILLGGFIGAGVDMGTGAAYDYPTEIIVPLDCRSEAEIAEAPTTGNTQTLRQNWLMLINARSHSLYLWMELMKYTRHAVKMVAQASSSVGLRTVYRSTCRAPLIVVPLVMSPSLIAALPTLRNQPIRPSMSFPRFSRQSLMDAKVR
ncbi:MAG: hypothetical protein IPJ33_05660 [Gammaproteobacteria bacterium]|nr:hypothetical protein [Gammaproteobacteria bacterium]